jgi:membrane associated rhomboid family serine protease
MIPLRSSERIHSPTPVVITLIVVNILLFFYELSLGYAMRSFVARWGIVPDLINRNLWALLTSMFLHGGWLHLLGNMAFLWVFGRNIEDRLGSRNFAILYVACGLAAAVIHVIVNPYSRVPTIGASGAIAGVMGAYLIKFWKSDIDTLFWMIFVWRMPVPAPYFLIYWFVVQFFSGLGSIGETDYTGGGVAWFAHIGGFLAGMGLVKAFKDTRPAYRAWYEED